MIKISNKILVHDRICISEEFLEEVALCVDRFLQTVDDLESIN